MILPYATYAAIIPTYSINSVTVNNLFKKINAGSLVLINIENTIITPKSAMFRCTSPYKGFIDELSSLAKYQTNIDEVIAKLILQRQVILVEPNWSKFLDKLKGTGAMVFGFSKSNPAYNKIKDFEEWQYSQLTNLGINFTKNVNNKEIFKFDETDITSPIFYRGIIFTGSLNKARALEEFINITNITPSNIFIFENSKVELNNINNFLQTVDLDYYGVEYLAITELAGSPDTDIVKLQQELFLKTGKWLEDEDAKQLMLKDKLNNGNQLPVTPKL
jgi:hypothetical protein